MGRFLTSGDATGGTSAAVVTASAIAGRPRKAPSSRSGNTGTILIGSAEPNTGGDGQHNLTVANAEPAVGDR